MSGAGTKGPDWLSSAMLGTGASPVCCWLRRMDLCHHLTDALCWLPAASALLLLPLQGLHLAQHCAPACRDVNLELHCDIAPRTCENFLILAESGYYTGTPFHRCIRNFMIQVQAPAPACACTDRHGYLCRPGQPVSTRFKSQAG